MASIEIKRGFSFMCELKSDATDLKLIESSELERTWKTTIRERQKVQEKKIWEEFCENHDVLQEVFQDDPYQFLEDLPDSYIEILEQSEKIEESNRSEVIGIEDEDTRAGGDSPSSPYLQNKEAPFPADHISENIDSSDLPLALNSERHDGNNEIVPEVQSPCTVREFTERSDRSKYSEPSITERSVKHNEENEGPEKEQCEEKESNRFDEPKRENKKSELKRTNSFEANVYFEKVKGLRIQINEVLLCITELLQEQLNVDCDPVEMIRMQKRANEFSSRFSRIYVYQLQRQLNDLQRNMALSLPFAKRTQFQAQATRVVSLHQNTLQALQVFHRPLEKALCLGDGTHLQALLSFVREASVICCEVVPSQELKQRSQDMYNDEVMTSCGILERLMKKHVKSLQAIIEDAKFVSPPQSRRKPKAKQAKRSQLPYGQKLAPSKQEKRSRSKHPPAGGQLSMYSVDNMQLDLKRAASSVYGQATRVDRGTEKPGSSISQIGAPPKSSASVLKGGPGGERGGSKTEEVPAAPAGRVPINKRPLMRDAAKRAPARKKNQPEEDIRTMVESVPENSPKNKYPARATSPLSPKSSQRSPGTAAGGAGGAGGAAGCDVNALLRRLCGGEAKEAAAATATAADRSANANRSGSCVPGRRVGGAAAASGARNVRLVCVSGDAPPAAPSPRRAPPAAAATAHLLKILEENIHKQSPSPKANQSNAKSSLKEHDPEKHLLHFSISEKTSENLLNYRTQFMQYMMASPMYANSVFRKPWETVARVSDEIIQDLLVDCAMQMQIESVLQDMCQVETTQ